jgi:uncharacterized protein YndB with AHSA1/START domain
MATVSTSPDPDVLVLEIQIAAPLDRVFQAITDPKQVPEWWGQEGIYRVTRWEGELRPGGKWRSQGVGADGTPFEVDGEYVEIERPHLLVHTWNASWAHRFPTTVRWELKAQPEGTLVTLRHSGFTGQPQAAKNHAQGWRRVLGWMQAFVEKAETINRRT